MNTLIKEYKPCDSLNPYIELFWEGSFNANASGQIALQMIPNGCLDLIIHLNELHCDLHDNNGWSQSPDFMILGMFTQPYEVRFQNHVRVFAIRFKPDGIYNILGVPASLLKDNFHDMSMVLCSRFYDFSNRLKEEKSVATMIIRAENYLLKSLQDSKTDLSYVNAAAELIRNCTGIKIKEVADKVCISQRQLERAFKDKVGISPKHYLRITRMKDVLRYLNDHQELNLVKVAYHCGYFDQAHFINDFKRFTGKKPSVFIKKSDLYITNPL